MAEDTGELSAFDAWALECIRSGDVTADTQPGVAARLAWLACAKSKSATIESLRAQLATMHALSFKAGIEAGAEVAKRQMAEDLADAGEYATARGIYVAITSLPTPPSMLPEILEVMRPVVKMMQDWLDTSSDFIEDDWELYILPDGEVSGVKLTITFGDFRKLTAAFTKLGGKIE